MSFLTNPYRYAGEVTEFIDNPISDVWTAVNTSLWTIGSGRATFDGASTSAPNIARYDLQDSFGSGNNLSDTTWTIRWSGYLDIVTGGSGNKSMCLGVWSEIGAHEGSSNGIDAMVMDSKNACPTACGFHQPYCTWCAGGSAISSWGAYTSTAVQVMDTQYYYQLQRIALDDFELKIFTDSGFSSQLGDTWAVSNDPVYVAAEVEAITDLRYLEFGYRPSAASYIGIGWNTFMEVYNDTLSP